GGKWGCGRRIGRGHSGRSMLATRRCLSWHFPGTLLERPLLLRSRTASAIRLTASSTRSVCRTLSVPQIGRHVLGATLNCSESRRAAAAAHPGSFDGTCFEGRGLGFPGARVKHSPPKRSRSGGVGEAESNIEWVDLVSTPAAADRNASFTVERINLLENNAKTSRRKCEFDQIREVP